MRGHLNNPREAISVNYRQVLNIEWDEVRTEAPIPGGASMFCFLLLGTSFVLELLVFLLLPIALIVLARMLGMLTRPVMRSDGFISIVFGVLIDRYRLLRIGSSLLIHMPCRNRMLTR